MAARQSGEKRSENHVLIKLWTLKFLIQVIFKISNVYFKLLSFIFKMIYSENQAFFVGLGSAPTTATVF